MSDENDLVRHFEQHRDYLRFVARRILGSDGQADDAVQDAWLRIAHSDVSEVHSLRNWLTTIVARLCLVLHDLFAVQFDHIAPIIGRSPAATRQLASRARRRLTGAPTEIGASGPGAEKSLPPSSPRHATGTSKG
ncbi:sigma factor [Paracoccus sp. TOH]|uniref:Sigma factor n=1 Tax=Paracoccus simplex TaxID=2086346 RepID=A0ABV7RVM0_9RHOB